MPFYALLGNYNRPESMELSCLHQAFPILLDALLFAQFAAAARSVRHHFWMASFAVHSHSINRGPNTFDNRRNSVDFAVFQRINHSIRANEPMIFRPNLRGCDAFDWDQSNHPVCMINPENYDTK